jgi:importin subunit beta-1
MVVIL